MRRGAATIRLSPDASGQDFSLVLREGKMNRFFVGTICWTLLGCSAQIKETTKEISDAQVLDVQREGSWTTTCDYRITLKSKGVISQLSKVCGPPMVFKGQHIATMLLVAKCGERVVSVETPCRHWEVLMVKDAE